MRIVPFGTGQKARPQAGFWAISCRNSSVPTGGGRSYSGRTAGRGAQTPALNGWLGRGVYAEAGGLAAHAPALRGPGVPACHTDTCLRSGIGAPRARRVFGKGRAARLGPRCSAKCGLRATGRRSRFSAPPSPHWGTPAPTPPPPKSTRRLRLGLAPASRAFRLRPESLRLTRN